MNIASIATTVAIVGGLGLFIAVILGLFQKLFAVKTDEREGQVRECLPGNNCGGCGYAGCDSLAQAIASGEAPASACPVAGADGARKIAEIMGVEVDVLSRKTAFVRCAGTCDHVKSSSLYSGAESCGQAALVSGHGGKACVYACTGLGSCVKACPFDAITVKDGVAHVDKERCTACGKCVSACPFDLIELIPYDAAVGVQCRSHATGKATRAACSAGCIACGKCVKTCPSDAITMENNVAYIHQDRCVRCGKCAEACPVKVIRVPSLSADER